MNTIWFQLLNLGISCKNHSAGCEFTAVRFRESVLAHEGDCPYRKVKCDECRKNARFNHLEEHTDEHDKARRRGNRIRKRKKMNMDDGYVQNC